MSEVVATPKMLWTPSGFYCTHCDYYFNPVLDRSGLPNAPVRWTGVHDKVELCPFPCSLEGSSFEIDITEVFPAAREVGK